MATSAGTQQNRPLPYLISRPGYRRDAGPGPPTFRIGAAATWSYEQIVQQVVAQLPWATTSAIAAIMLKFGLSGCRCREEKRGEGAKMQERAASVGGQEAADGHHRRGPDQGSQDRGIEDGRNVSGIV
jgi:hypothetical protein